jgi:hypothetical protein
MDELDRYVRPDFLTEEQQAYIRSLKIPVDSDYPGTYWIASLSYESVMPTEVELKMIQSYIEYAIKSHYNQTYQDGIFAKVLPAAGGHVTKIFRKGARWAHQPDPLEGWVYRLTTWERGHWPQWPEPRVSLIQVLDHIHQYVPYPDPRMGEEEHLSPAWVKWKAQHPDIFSLV